jgi:polysaccharide biosynthesis transport protein
MQAVSTSPDRPNFSKYWFILKRHWLPAGALAIALFGFMVVNILSKPNIYQAKGQLRFSLSEGTPRISGIEDLTNSYNTDNYRLLATEIRAMLSREFLRSVVQRMPSTAGTKGSQMNEGSLQKGLKVVPIVDTDIVEITFNSEDPALAAQVVNKFLQVYAQANLQSSQTKSRITREFIVSQLPQVRQRVFVADSALKRFKENYRVFDLNAIKAGTADIQVKIQDQLGTIEAQIADIKAQSSSLRRQLGVSAQDAIVVSSVGQSPAVQDVLKSVEDVQKQLKEARTRLSPEHPAILDLQDREQELQILLRERVSTSLNAKGFSEQKPLFVGNTRQGLLDNLIKNESAQMGLLQQRQTLINQKAAYANQAKGIPGLELRQRELERELAAAESTYQSLLKGLQDAQIAENQTIPTVKVIDSAVIPTAPIAPNRPAQLMQGAIAALLAGAALAYLLDLMDRKLKTVDSIREFYPYPLLGNIPLFEVSNAEYRRVPVFAEPNSTVSEAYRMLQANLKFLRSDNPVRLITISSAQPGEGKSVTASNLAAVLSQLGHQVLLIDADLRRPTTHQIWEIPNGFGLSNVLTDTEGEDFKTLPIHTINENLHVLTAGPIPPNPLALIDSQRMEAFLKAQAQKFDYVLVDTPPLTVAADPLVISRFTDGLLLVARPDTLEKASVNMAQNTLKQSETTVLGMVANGVLVQNESYYYYYYSKNYYGNDRNGKSKIDEDKGVVMIKDK